VHVQVLEEDVGIKEEILRTPIQRVLLGFRFCALPVQRKEEQGFPKLSSAAGYLPAKSSQVNIFYM